jgi:hypothetical protein
MRALLLASTFSFAASVVACSTSPGDPTLPLGPDGKPLDRRYEPACPLADVPEKTAGDTFTSLYDDLFSDQGAARCQNGACHGGSAAQGDLALKSSKEEMWCSMIGFGLIAPKTDCSSCQVCKDSGSTCATPAASRSGAECCFVSCGSEVKFPGINPLINQISPTKSGPAPMPRDVCEAPSHNRKLTPAEIARVKAWGMKGAPLD